MTQLLTPVNSKKKIGIKTRYTRPNLMLLKGIYINYVEKKHRKQKSHPKSILM